VCCSVLRCVAVCCSVLQHVAVCCCVLRCVAVCCGVLQCVAVCCSVLQCVAVCCSVLWCVAVCCIEQRRHRTKQDVSLADMHSHYVTQVRSGVLVAASSCVHVMFFSNTPDQGNSSLAYMHRVAEVGRGVYA